MSPIILYPGVELAPNPPRHSFLRPGDRPIAITTSFARVSSATGRAYLITLVQSSSTGSAGLSPLPSAVRLSARFNNIYPRISSSRPRSHVVKPMRSGKAGVVAGARQPCWGRHCWRAVINDGRARATGGSVALHIATIRSSRGPRALSAALIRSPVASSLPCWYCRRHRTVPSETSPG
ncbi:hypothetical protein GWK47_022593 [Chionoecetes opilio]|uniref:Uncharacterized protein n=1 Tax=Chionoecetes opilio TaxID=41210 RepID=A0A8J4XMP4_CHIOP|nr:hypothetical protein GWK47_022593 [Chionoecetes opilio]